MEENIDDEYMKEIEAAQKAEKEKFANNGGPESIPLLTWPEAGVRRYLEKDPPEQDYLFENLILRKVVYGLFATGGTGKSYLLLQMVISLATGRNFGPFRPTRTNKVIYIGAEDPDCELHRRTHLAADYQGLLHSKELSENLAIYSAAGKIGPILMLDGKGNPTTTKHYDWLKRSIESLNGIEVLILDPMSRLYGLNENDNAG